MSSPRTYSDDEVRAIIDRALTGATRDGLSHADLLAVGEQVGISADAMARAADAVVTARDRDVVTRAVMSKRRRWLAAHAGLFVLVNGLLFAINWLTTPGEWWALFPIFFWGLALALHAAANAALPVSTRARPGQLARARNDQLALGEKTRVVAPAEVAESVNAAEDAEAPAVVRRA